MQCTTQSQSFPLLHIDLVFGKQISMSCFYGDGEMKRSCYICWERGGVCWLVNLILNLDWHMDWEHFCWLEVVSLFPLVVVTFNCNWNCYFYCYYLNLFYFYFISFVWLLASEWWLPLECLRCFLLIVVLWLLHLVLLLRCNCRCFLLLMLFLLLLSDPWFTCGLFEKCPDEENTK